MFGGSQMQKLEVNHNIDDVYEALLNGIATISAFKLKGANKDNHSIDIGVRMSFFSWGENLTVTLSKIDDAKTEILFIGQSKLGTEIMAGSKNKQNISKLTNAMLMFLKN